MTNSYSLFHLADFSTPEGQWKAVKKDRKKLIRTRQISALGGYAGAIGGLAGVAVLTRNKQLLGKNFDRNAIGASIGGGIAGYIGTKTYLRKGRPVKGYIRKRDGSKHWAEKAGI